MQASVNPQDFFSKMWIACFSWLTLNDDLMLCCWIDFFPFSRCMCLIRQFVLLLCGMWLCMWHINNNISQFFVHPLSLRTLWLRGMLLFTLPTLHLDAWGSNCWGQNVSGKHVLGVWQLLICADFAKIAEETHGAWTIVNEVTQWL